MWPAIHIRSDIVYSRRVLGRYCSNPGVTNCKLVIQIFKYLFGTLDLGITFTAVSEDELVSYTDFYYLRLIDGLKITGSYILMLSGRPLSDQSKLWYTIPLLLIEAEYMATTGAGKNALWVAQFLVCLRFCLSRQRVELRTDNKGKISLTKNPESHRKIKYIELHWHLIQDKVERKQITILYISIKEMLADGLTKALSSKIFKDFWRRIEITLAGHFRPSGRVGVEGRISWKVLKIHGKWSKIIESDGKVWS